MKIYTVVEVKNKVTNIKTFSKKYEAVDYFNEITEHQHTKVWAEDGRNPNIGDPIMWTGTYHEDGYGVDLFVTDIKEEN